jgi:hypothetical protein
MAMAPPPAAAPAAPAPAPAAAAPAPAAAPAAPAAVDGLEVVSPMAGTVYRAPAPGEAPFVKVKSSAQMFQCWQSGVARTSVAHPARSAQSAAGGRLCVQGPGHLHCGGEPRNVRLFDDSADRTKGQLRHPSGSTAELQASFGQLLGCLILPLHID